MNSVIIGLVLSATIMFAKRTIDLEKADREMRQQAFLNEIISQVQTYQQRVDTDRIDIELARQRLIKSFRE